jgi:hypothetical protein
MPLRFFYSHNNDNSNFVNAKTDSGLTKFGELFTVVAGHPYPATQFIVEAGVHPERDKK